MLSRKLLLPPLFAILASLPALAGECLTQDDLLVLFPGAKLEELSPEELRTCQRSSQLCKLKALLEAAVATKAQPRDTGPAAPDDSAPGFEGLVASGEPSLSDAELEQAFGPERYAKMNRRKREEFRTNKTLVKWYGLYQSGRVGLPALRDTAANLLESWKPQLETKLDRSLREQLPVRGKHFTLDLNWTTGLLYVERDRKQNQRDQQIANVLAALRDEDDDSDIDELLERISSLSKGQPVKILLNLKMLHRGSIGTYDAFKLISLGMENPWLSVNIPLRYLRSVICHELGHLLQDYLYGRKPTVGPVARFAGLRHNPEVTTNEAMALSEGWGDFCGVTFGKSDYWDWQEGYRHEDYDEKRPLKSRRDLLRTEGVVTQTLLLASHSVGDFREKVIATFQRRKPGSIAALVDGFAKDHPADGAKLRAALEEVLKGSK